MHASPPLLLPSFLSFSQNTKMMIKYRSGGVNFPALSLGPRSAPSPFPSLFPSPPQSTSCKTSKSWEAVAGEGVANGWMDGVPSHHVIHTLKFGGRRTASFEKTSRGRRRRGISIRWRRRRRRRTEFLLFLARFCAQN